MSRWPKDTQSARNAFYGDPGKSEIAHQMVPVVPPFAMYYEGKRVKAIQFHRLAAPALLAALTEIWDFCEHDQKKIDASGASKYFGAYNHRYVRGSTTKWSNHAYATAIDLNALQNALGRKGNMPAFIVDAFCRQGAMWGGWYKDRPDWMHFEFVDNGGRKPSSPRPVWPRAVAVGLLDEPSSAAPADEMVDEAPEAPEPEVETTETEKPPVDRGDPTILSVQKRLRDLGYFEIGEPDGGTNGMARTEGAILAFRNDNNLGLSTEIDDDLIVALAKASPRKVSEKRATATVEDLRDKGSTTITLTDRIKKAAGWLLGSAVVGGGASGGDVIDSVTNGATKIGGFKQALDHVGIGIGAVVLLGVAALVIWYFADRAQKNRVAEYQKGKNT